MSSMRSWRLKVGRDFRDRTGGTPLVWVYQNGYQSGLPGCHTFTRLLLHDFLCLVDLRWTDNFEDFEKKCS